MTKAEAAFVVGEKLIWDALGGGKFLTLYLAQPLVPARPYQGCGATARGRR